MTERNQDPQRSRKFGLLVPLDLYQQFQLVYQQFQGVTSSLCFHYLWAFHDSPRNLQGRVWSGLCRCALPEDTSKTRPQIASLRNFQQVIMKSSQILPLDGPNPFDTKTGRQVLAFLPGPASTKKGYGIYSPVLNMVLIQLAWFV